MTGIHLTSVSGLLRLECFTGNPGALRGQFVAVAVAGDPWEIIAAKVSQHQAAHGCGRPEDQLPAR